MQGKKKYILVSPCSLSIDIPFNYNKLGWHYVIIGKISYIPINSSLESIFLLYLYIYEKYFQIYLKD